MSLSADIPSDRALLRLMQLASPALPVGAYSYSEGLEYVVQAGVVKDSATLRAWIEDGLAFGAGQLEAAVMVRAYDAWLKNDLALVQHWDRWLSAARDSEELRNQSLDMGRALLRLLKDLQPPLPQVATLFAAPCNFASAFGIAGAHWGIARESLLAAYLQSGVANLVSAGVKLIPLGQTAGQQLLWDFHDAVAQCAQRVGLVGDDELGVGNWGATLASMGHETQYMRLFRS